MINEIENKSKTPIQQPDPDADSNSEFDSEFDMIDYSEVTDLEHEINNLALPWLEPSHPLFIPPMQNQNQAGKNRWKALNLFAIENWYSTFQSITFNSTFIPLNYEEVAFLAGKDVPTFDEERFRQKLTSAMEVFSDKSAFLRLSTRSPKDSSALFEKASVLMSEERDNWEKLTNKNQQMVALMIALTQAMKVSSASEIIEIIKNSIRVQGDLLSLLQNSEPGEQATQIIFREWVPMRTDHEFRVFVSKADRTSTIVTAISQYFHFLYFDTPSRDSITFYTEQEHNALKQAIQRFVLSQITPNMDVLLNESEYFVNEYIVDVALVPIDEGDVDESMLICLREQYYKLILIELNPFFPVATSSALFNWQTDLNALWGKVDMAYPMYAYRTEPVTTYDFISLLPANYDDVIANATRLRTNKTSKDTVHNLIEKSEIFSPSTTMFVDAKNEVILKPHL